MVVPGNVTPADLSTALPAALLWGDGGVDRVLRNFEFLGAAIGNDAFVAQHTATRVAKTTALLEAIAELEDPQVALLLLRASAGHSRLLHSMRCNPPLAQQAALEHFDSLVRDCFSSFTGLHLVQTQWEQVTRGLAQAGLSLRSTSSDAPAANLPADGYPLPTAFSITSCGWCVGGLASRQRTLVAQADMQAWRLQLEASCPTGKALLLSEAEPGGRAFLAAVPELRHQLGVAEAFK